MDSLDSLVHPQAWAAALALADLSIGWMIATAALLGLLRERNRAETGSPGPSPAHRRRFA